MKLIKWIKALFNRKYKEISVTDYDENGNKITVKQRGWRL